MRKYIKLIIPIAVGLIIIAFCVWMRFGDGLLPQGPQLPDIADSVDAPTDTDDPSLGEGEDIPNPPDEGEDNPSEPAEGDDEPKDNNPDDGTQEDPIPEEPETPVEPEIPVEPDEPEIPSEPEKLPVEVEKITLNVYDVTLYVGDGVKVSATVHPADAEDKNVKWSSSNTAVATVSGGSIKGVGVGEATVTAKTSNGVSVTLKVTVTKPTVNVESITLTPGTVEMFVGESGKVFATVYPEDADDKTVTFTSSDPSVLSVDKDGTVKGLRVGTAFVTGTTVNGKSASVNVTVKPIEIAASAYEYHYETLDNQAEKRFYEAVREAMINSEKTISGSDALSATLTEVDIQDVFYKVLLDHPEFFHVTGEYMWYTTGGVISSLEISYNMSAKEYEAAIEFINESLKPLAEEMRGVSTEGERALIAYNFVKDRFVYDTSLAIDSHNMYKAYLSGMAVCEGYSKLFGYILNSVGIPSTQVVGVAGGSNHQWTMAILGGKWYHFDPTWDDPITQLSYSDRLLHLNYFAVSDALMLENRTVDASLVMPKADSLQENYYIRNALTVTDLSSETLKRVGKASSELCGHVAFMCTTDLFNTILSDTSYLWTMVKAATSEAKTINYTYNQDSRVIEIVY